MNVVEVGNLVKAFGKKRAVDDISFAVSRGEIFGILGPNGAGKTTTIECILGLKKPTSGSTTVLGMSSRAQRAEFYARVGAQLQETAYQDNIKVYEVCELFSSFYKNPLPYDELLNRFGIFEKRNEFAAKLSGGQRQCLSIALALISNPEVVFFDELTTGLDPNARRIIWEQIKKLRDEGRTVVMTTHYMEEAEYLCDRLCFINKGKLAALDTVNNIIAASGIDSAVIIESVYAPVELLHSIAGVRSLNCIDNRVTLYGDNKRMLANTVAFLDDNNIEYDGLNYRRPNLEDVFLKMTGSTFENQERV